ncbi:MAG: DUF531 family protein [Thermoplasmatota archaeon]
MTGRLTLGLYNSYDPRKLQEAHRRALARAGALASAFDANLAVFGFPFSELGGDVKFARGETQAAREGATATGRGAEIDLTTPVGIAEAVSGSTSVGEDGAYFVELARAGRFQVFDYPKRGFPPQLGTAVLATRNAACPRDTSARTIARDLVDGRSQLILFGLGPHGVPREVFEMCAWEFDVSGKQTSLETATAMGAVVASIAAHVEMLDGAQPHRHVRAERA